MDLQFEVTSSRVGNKDEGFLLGNVTGRDARAYEGRFGYWVSPRTRIESGYRQEKISGLYLPSGGTVTDGFLKTSWAFKPEWTVDAFAQYERFLIPSMEAGRQTNGSARLQITWTPRSVSIPAAGLTGFESKRSTRTKCYLKASFSIAQGGLLHDFRLYMRPISKTS